MNVISIDLANAEMEKWLDHKRVSVARRESKKLAIDGLASEIAAGNLVLMPDTFKLKYTLKFPITSESGEEALSELEFMPRLRAQDVVPYMKGIKADDLKGTLRANIAALTRKSMGIIQKMDTEDMDVAESVSLFFI